MLKIAPNKNTHLTEDEASVLDEYVKLVKGDVQGASDQSQDSENNKEKSLEKVLILMHNRPDPDALDSSVLLQEVFKENGIDSTILYSYETNNYQNLEMFTEYELRKNIKRTDDIRSDPEFSSLEDFLQSFKHVAFVDTQDPQQQIAYFNCLNPEASVMLIDHHEEGGDLSREGQVFTLKRNAGACASILLDYMKQKGWDFSSDEFFRFRGLSYMALKTDTGNFQKMTKLDKVVLQSLKDALDDNKDEWDTIKRIENPTIRKEVIFGYSDVLKNCERVGNDVLVSSLPEVIKKDTARMAYYADKLMDSEPWEKADHPSVVIVYGPVEIEEKDGKIIHLMASGRSYESRIDLIDLFENTFYIENGEGKKIKCSGGRKIGPRTMMAGADLMIGYDEYKEDAEALNKRWQADNRTIYRPRIFRYLGFDESSKEVYKE